MAQKIYKTEDGLEYTRCSLALIALTADFAMQPRVEMNAEHVKYLATMALEQDARFEIDVFTDGTTYWIVDGFHRYRALMSLKHMGKKFESVNVRIFRGSEADAFVFAAQANKKTMLPLKDLDKREAMFNLMRFPEWRQKSPPEICRAVGISAGAGYRYHKEWFDLNGVDFPASTVARNGQLRPTKRTRKTDGNRKITTHKNGGKNITIGGETIYLGSCTLSEDQSKEKVQALIDSREAGLAAYRNSHSARQRLYHHNILAKPIEFSGVSSRNSLYGLRWMEVGLTPISLEHDKDQLLAIARVMLCGVEIEATRLVVLCPEFGRSEAIVGAARKLGIEFMTINEFAASVAGQTDTEPESESEPNREPASVDCDEPGAA